MRAVVFGIDASGNLPTLPGCEDDALAMADCLRTHHQCQVTVLTPAAKEQQYPLTADGVRSYLRHFFRMQTKETLVFYYSGHGTRINLSSGDQGEALVWHDGTALHILPAREIVALVNEAAAAGARVYLILDCCFSGGMNRQHQMVKSCVLSPSVLAAALARSNHDSERTLKPRAGSWWLPTNFVVLAACHGFEQAHQIFLPGLGWRGVFSQFLLPALSTWKPHQDLKELFGRVSAQVSGRVTGQHPQLLGHPFWLARQTSESARTWVSEHEGDLLVLPLGSLHGVTAKDCFEIADVLLSIKEVAPGKCWVLWPKQSPLPALGSHATHKPQGKMLRLWVSQQTQACPACMKVLLKCPYLELVAQSKATLCWDHQQETPSWQTRWGPYSIEGHAGLSHHLVFLHHFASHWYGPNMGGEKLRVQFSQAPSNLNEKETTEEDLPAWEGSSLEMGRWVYLTIINTTPLLLHVAALAFFQWGIEAIFPKCGQQATALLFPQQRINIPFQAWLDENQAAARERIWVMAGSEAFDTRCLQRSSPGDGMRGPSSGSAIFPALRVALDYEIRRHPHDI